MTRTKTRTMKDKPAASKPAPKSFEEAADETIKTHKGALKRLAKL